MYSHLQFAAGELYSLIRRGEILFAGNLRLKIYGKLNCASGKRLNQVNRVFFKNENEALQNGFRPCGNCLKAKYKDWKNGLI